METINTNVVKQQPKLTGQIGNTLIYVDPDLEDKKVEIVENGVYTIKADEKFDGLNEVEVNANVSLTPKKGFVVEEWTDDGWAKKIRIVGFTQIPDFYFSPINGGNQEYGIRNRVEEVIIDEGTEKLGWQLFYAFKKLTKVTLPSTLKDLSNGTKSGVFDTCSSLTNIDFIPDGIHDIPMGCFQSCSKLTIKTLPEHITSLNSLAFAYCSGITQMSVRTGNVSSGGGSYAGSFVYCSELSALWLGSEFRGNYYQLYTYYDGKFKKLFIDKPRSEVESMTGWSRGFQTNNSSSIVTKAKDSIVCNDDEGWMTQDEFDAIDWKNYTE